MNYSAVPLYISFLKFKEIYFLFHCIASRIFLKRINSIEELQNIQRYNILTCGTVFKGFPGYKNIRKQVLLDDKR